MVQWYNKYLWTRNFIKLNFIEDIFLIWVLSQKSPKEHKYIDIMETVDETEFGCNTFP